MSFTRARHRRTWGRAAIAALTLAATAVGGTGAAGAAAFGAGNLLVCRVGDGAAGLVNTGAAVFLDEYTPSGTLVQSIAMPTTVSGANRRLIASGTATSECALSLSADGRYVLLAGYDAALGGATSLSGTTSVAVPRTIARVDWTGNVDTTTSLTDAASGNNPRGATSTDGNQLWIVGGAGGIRSAVLGGTTSTQLSTTVANLRQATIAGGQLFVSTSSGSAVRVGTVGSGTPTTAGQTITNLPGFPTAGSPYAFAFADLTASVVGNDTLYVADDSPGTIQKYSLVGGTWVASGSISATGVRGLTLQVSGATVTLYGTTGGSAVAGGGSIYVATDASGYNVAATGTASSVATAAINTAMRGIVLTPQNTAPPVEIPEVPFAVLASLSALVVLGGMTMIRRRGALA